MNLNIECSVSNNIFVEVSCYICDGKIEVASEILKNLNQKELELLIWIKKDAPGYPLTEFFVHSPDKSFNGMLNYISSLPFIDFLYIFHAESIIKEKIDLSSEYIKEKDVESIVSLMNKVHDFLKIQIDESEYKDKLFTLYNGLKKYPPLEYCQNIMGKRFARVSEYKKYFFVPVKYVASFSACRIFNSSELLQMIPVKDKKKIFTDDEIYQSLKIIADKTRLEIIKYIKDKSYYGKELADILNMKPPTISHHIDQLNKIGLIHLEQIGNTKYFSLNRIRFRELITSLERFL